MTMKCPICRENGKAIFSGVVLKRYKVHYYQCPNCGVIYTEKPYWLEEAYGDSIINTDVGIMQRNIAFSQVANVLLHTFYKSDAYYLDYGGGYGIFTRMMRDLGYRFLWLDKYSPNLVARGFGYHNEKVELITAFELFEHFEKPIEEIENLLSLSGNILFSTLIYDDGLKYPALEDWWYYAPHGGQHIMFYSGKTLMYLAKRYQLFYYQIDKDLHLFSKKEIKSFKANFYLKGITGKLYKNILWIINKSKGLTGEDLEYMLKIDSRD